MAQVVNKICVMAFGRFQPATIGHKLMIEKVRNTAIEKEKEGYTTSDPKIFISGSTNDKNKIKKSTEYKKMLENEVFCSFKLNENPLKASDKIKFMNKAYNDGNSNKKIEFIDSKSIGLGNPFLALVHLKTKYDKIIFFCGSDRFDRYTKMGRNIANDKIEVRNLLRGDDTDELVKLVQELSLKTKSLPNPSSMSGTQMRIAALQKNYKKFSTGVGIEVFPNLTQKDILDFMAKIRDGIELVSDPEWKGYNIPEYCKKWPFHFKTPRSWGPDWRHDKEGYYTRRKARLKRISDKKSERQDRQLTKDVLNMLPGGGNIS